ncbi:hypothetical protein [Flavobacterium sp. 3HN19-14]|uniref:hypothetical protein n=1 Tax=Flavobacterium sp. 3HN19-14 TaxID=3448133 RepID=UPI003EDF85FC
MSFSTRIFVPDLPKRFTLTRSQKVSTAAFLLFIFTVIIGLINGFFDIKIINYLLIGFTLLVLLGLIASDVMRLTEYENLNGHLEGMLEIDIETIRINDASYFFNEITDFKIGIHNYSGQRTGNRRSGRHIFRAFQIH